MRRIILMVTAAALMAALAAMSALPAFAKANDNANCVGQTASTRNQAEPGVGGKMISSTAKESGGVGEFASSNDCSVFDPQVEIVHLRYEILNLGGYEFAFCVTDAEATNLDPNTTYDLDVLYTRGEFSLGDFEVEIPEGETSFSLNEYYGTTGLLGPGETLTTTLYNKSGSVVASDEYTCEEPT